MLSWPARLAAVGLIVLMAAGSLALWTAIPAGWLWLAGQLSNSNIFSYFMALVGSPIVIVVGARALYRLNDLYLRVTGKPPTVAARAAWLNPISGEKKPQRPRTILDVFMVSSALMAVIAYFVWQMFIAGSPLEGLGL
jgi:hypothetical protein